MMEKDIDMDIGMGMRWDDVGKWYDEVVKNNRWDDKDGGFDDE